MQQLSCIVLDKDTFLKKLLSSFISKTEGVTELSDADLSKADVLFVDAALYEGDYMLGLNPATQVVVVSANNIFIKALFDKEIADFLPKSEITYDKFLESVSKVRNTLSA